MKILLTMNLPWVLAVGGANKCNRALAAGLAAAGHRVRAVVPALAVPSRWTHDEVRRRLAASGVEVRREDGVDVFTDGGVEVHAVAAPSRLRAELAARLADFSPDWALVSSEDPSQNLLDAALAVAVAPVVYLAHTPAFLPFGPQAFYPSERRARRLGRAAGVVAASRYLADYARRWGGLQAAAFRFPVYDPGPYPDFAGRGEFVTLINPCAVKGIAIFLGLARALPAVRFAAVPTWGTTAADRAALAALPNVTLLEPAEDVDRIYERTRVLLMPSLWQEAFGVAAVEAMLRGLPVVASDAGGLPEATLGTGFVLPVRPIERFGERLDGNGVPEPEVPEQDLAPWRQAVCRLLAEPALYARQSAAARAAALDFVAGLGVGAFEEILARLPRRLAPAVATVVDEAPERRSELTPEQRALLMLRLRRRAAAHDAAGGEGAAPSIPRVARPPQVGENSGLPLAFAQQRLWFLDQWQPGAPVYNIPAAVRLRGRLDLPAFAGALCAVVRRHEALRTSFPAVQGRPAQRIAPDLAVPVPLVDLESLPAAARAEEVEELSRAAARRPFDLARGPLLRLVLLRLAGGAGEEHRALVCLHHIVADGWSIGILVREIAALYGALHERRPPGLPELPIQYADFAVWQRGWLAGEELERQTGYWREHLAGAPPVLELPADRRRPAAQRFRGGRRPVALPAVLWARSRAFSRRHGATPFMTALAAFAALLCRLTGGADLVVGTPIANRNRAETEGLIGFFVNTLALRIDLAGDPGFRELAARVREEALGAYAHQDLPFEEVVKAVAAGRDRSHNPLFQVMFALHNAPRSVLAMAGLTIDFEELYGGTAKFDLDLMTAEAGDELGGAAEYDADLFDAATIDRLLGQWRRLLAAALGDPERHLSELPLLDPAECHQLIAEWNDTAVPFPGGTLLHEPFVAQAARDPGAVAVLWGTDEARLTYGELAASAARLARRLTILGVAPGERVGICVERSPAMVVGLLAIAIAGGAYMPLDPAYPAARLALLLADSRARVFLTHETLADRIPAAGARLVLLDALGAAEGRRRFPGVEEAGAAAHVAVASDLPAYVIYTSGSTGAPKAAVLDHRGRVNNFLDFNRRFGVGPADRLLAVSSLAFDMTAYDVFGMLAAGGAVVLPLPGVALDPAHWAELIERHGVTLWHSAPALLEMLAGHLESRRARQPLPLRLALLGGDWIPPSLPARLRNRAAARVVALGGATEVSMDSTIFEIRDVDPAWSSIPYGVPMANQRAHVVDRRLQPAPLGVAGELLLGGAGVGNGYFARPELTAERFVPDPFTAVGGAPGGRLYRTGDLARWRSGGTLELLGRLDFQVKVRGVRVEPGEVAAALAHHEAVAAAVVAARPDAAGAPRLVGYVAPRRPVEPAELAAFLKERLPEALVPAAWVLLPALPLSPNGKVDRRALPDPQPGAGGAGEHVEPRTALERVSCPRTR
jgi:amino acid adenylation domain-containing protein